MLGMWTSLAVLWCRLRHRQVTWPVHGHYHCMDCGRTYRVGWEAPAPPAVRRPAASEAAVLAPAARELSHACD